MAKNLQNGTKYHCKTDTIFLGEEIFELFVSRVVKTRLSSSSSFSSSYSSSSSPPPSICWASRNRPIAL
jgi:hypothetical protein